MASHETTPKTDEWYSPPWIFEALGTRFDLDPCSPGKQAVPWIPASTHRTEDGLGTAWSGSVWMNPPFGKRNGIREWMERFVEHGNGIAIVPNRTGADWWQDLVPACDAVLFIRGKVRFLRPDGTQGDSPGYGNVLCARGGYMASALINSRIAGYRARGLA